MKFILIKDFIIMEVGKTNNQLTLSEEHIQAAIDNKMFDGAPIVFNEDQSYKNYKNTEENEIFIKSCCIGCIIPRSVTFNGIEVKADVVLRKDFNKKLKYDNWLITYGLDENNKGKITSFDSMELFEKGE